MLDIDENLSWLSKLDKDELYKHLTNDAKLIYDNCGIDVLIKLWEKLSSVNLYLADKPLMDLRRLYIRKNYAKTPAGDNAKELAVKLHISQQFVYLALQDKNGSCPDDPTLFPQL